MTQHLTLPMCPTCHGVAGHYTGCGAAFPHQVASAIRDARALAPLAAMRSSADLCLADAVDAFDTADYETAGRRALKSLAYSVGILSPTYQRHAVVLS